MKKGELARYRGLLDERHLVQFGRVDAKLFSIGARPVPQLPNPRKSAGNQVLAAAISTQPVPELDITATQGSASQQAFVALSTQMKNRAYERRGHRRHQFRDHAASRPRQRGDFKPEYAGKMNFYCSAVDDLLRHAYDAPTIGLILCQTKDRIRVEYALQDIHKSIGLAEYELTRAMPSIEDIKSELSDDANEGGAP